MASSKLAATDSLSVARNEFGEASINELEKLLRAVVVTGDGSKNDQKVVEFVDAAPHLSYFMAGALQLHTSSNRGVDHDEALFTTNARATLKALHGLVIGPEVYSIGVAAGASTTFRVAQPLAGTSLKAVLALEQRHLPAMLAANSSDVSALHFLAEVSAMRSLEEVAQAVKGPGGQEFVQTLRSSPTFASVVVFSSIWDDLWNGIKGAVRWVSDSVQAFGEEAAKVANAVVEGVFSRFEGLTKFVEEVPGIGLVVAGIYYIAGKTDQGTAALAINLNAIATFCATAIGLAVGGPAGAMIGGALGKTVGLLLQEAVAQFIKDPSIKADVADISATQWVIEIALAGGAGAGAAAIGKALGEEVGMSAVKAFIMSKGLSALLASLPAYLTKAAAQLTDQHEHHLPEVALVTEAGGFKRGHGPGPVIPSHGIKRAE